MAGFLLHADMVEGVAWQGTVCASLGLLTKPPMLLRGPTLMTSFTCLPPRQHRKITSQQGTLGDILKTTAQGAIGEPHRPLATCSRRLAFRSTPCHTLPQPGPGNPPAALPPPQELVGVQGRGQQLPPDPAGCVRGSVGTSCVALAPGWVPWASLARRRPLHPQRCGGDALPEGAHGQRRDARTRGAARVLLSLTLRC